MARRLAEEEVVSFVQQKCSTRPVGDAVALGWLQCTPPVRMKQA
jgi:hypothetical protein